MALSRFEIKIGTKGKAAPHCRYVLAEDKYFDKKNEVQYSHSGNLPSFCGGDALAFWSAADQYERANGSTYREHLLSLPRELTLNQNIHLVHDWINKEIGSQHAYTVAIHQVMASDGREQPHAHIMYCERANDGHERSAEQFFKRYNAKNPELGGAKKMNTGKKPSERRRELEEQRERYGDHLRSHLRMYGHKNAAEKIDMRNWQERGAEPPERHKPIWIVKAEQDYQRLTAHIERLAPSERTPPPTPTIEPRSQPQPKTNRDDSFDFSM